MHTVSVVMRHIVSILAGLIVAVSPALAQTPLAGPNINMVSGTTWPGGDPFLTKQNEISIAVSSLNPQHLLAGANDYRLTDPRTDIFDIEGEADAWLTVYKSTDGGLTWRTALIRPEQQRSDRWQSSRSVRRRWAQHHRCRHGRSVQGQAVEWLGCAGAA